MDFEAALLARLLAAPAVTGPLWKDPALSNRPAIYWEDRPQSKGLPAITLNYVIDARDQYMDGFQQVQRRLIQVDVWATSFATKKAMKEAVIATLEPAATSNGINFRPAVEVDAIPQNERTETQFIYRDAVRLTLFFSPA